LKVSNEAEVVAALRTLEGQTFPNGAAVRFQDVDYNVLSFKEQIKIDLGTFILFPSLFFSSPLLSSVPFSSLLFLSLPFSSLHFCYFLILLLNSSSLPACAVKHVKTIS
jgi:hypothetical protein